MPLALTVKRLVGFTEATTRAVIGPLLPIIGRLHDMAEGRKI